MSKKSVFLSKVSRFLGRGARNYCASRLSENPTDAEKISALTGAVRERQKNHAADSLPFTSRSVTRGIYKSPRSIKS